MRRLLLVAILALTPLVAMAQDAPPAPPAPPAPGAPGAPPDPTVGRPAMTPELRQAVRAMRAACAADMARLCPDAQAAAQSPDAQGGGQAGQRGRGGAMRCMMQHAADVSPPCAEAIGAVRALRHADHG